MARSTKVLWPLLALVATAFALTGCGGGATSFDAVANAADATQKAGSAKVAITGVTATNGMAQPLRMNGSGAFDMDARSGTLSFDMSGLPQGAGSSTLHMDMLFKKFVIYMKLPPALTARLPGGKPWLKLDLEQLGKAQGFDLGQLSSVNQSNPAETLDYLRAASGKLEKVGKERVRGVDTTHYRATVDLRKVPDAVPADRRAEVRQAVQRLIQLSGTRRIPVEVWVDGKDLVRRLKMDYRMNVSGQKLTTSMTEELYDFGTTVDVTPPPAGQVTDLAKLLQQVGQG